MTFQGRLEQVKNRLLMLSGRTGPSLVSIDVSGACNLRCLYCSLDASKPAPGMMRLSAFEALVPQLAGIPIVELSSGCEPTMNPELPRMVRLLRERHPTAFIDLTTNAMRLDEEIARALVDARIDKLLVSLDAASKELFGEIRRGAQLTRIQENLLRLDAIRRDRASRLPVVEVIFTLFAKNREELPKMPALLAPLGIRSLTVNGLAPFSRAMAPMKVWRSGEPPEGIVDLLRRAAREARKHGVSLLVPEFQPKRVRRCFDMSPVIAWNGDCSPCYICSFERTFYGEGEPVALPRLILGNVYERPLGEIWRSFRASAFRTGKALGFLPSYCRHCIMQMGVLCPSREAEKVYGIAQDEVAVSRDGNRSSCNSDGAA